MALPGNNIRVFNTLDHTGNSGIRLSVTTTISLDKRRVAMLPLGYAADTTGDFDNSKIKE